MTPGISKSTGSLISLILLAISTMCLCSSCTCCYCTTICHCEKGDYSFDPYVGYSDEIPCNNEARCSQACAEHNLGNVISSNPNGFGCYTSDCPPLFATPVLGVDEQKYETLLKFRDEVLAKSENGRKLIQFYYQHTEELAKLLEEHPALQKPVKELIELMMPAIEKIINNKETGKQPDA